MVTPRQRLACVAIVFGFCVTIPAATAGRAAAQGAVLGAIVLEDEDGARTPIPGLTVLLTHSVDLRRRTSVFTDALGMFFIYRIPLDPDPYYLDIYWGDDHLYRGRLFMTTTRLTLAPIVLR
jgi:hypothetical protein